MSPRYLSTPYALSESSDAPNFLVHSKTALYSCGWVSEPSPGPQGWYIQALAMWGNLTSDATLVTRCDDSIAEVCCAQISVIASGSLYRHRLVIPCGRKRMAYLSVCTTSRYRDQRLAMAGADLCLKIHPPAGMTVIIFGMTRVIGDLCIGC